jgi:hypothetical protein
VEFISRRIWAFVIFTAAVVAVGMFYFARIAREGVTHDLAAWADQQRGRGWQVEGQIAPTHDYWFSPAISLRNVHLHAYNELLPGGVDVVADQVDLRVDLRNPALLHVVVRGVSGFQLGTSPAQRIIADHLTATVRLKSGGQIVSVAIDGKNLRPPQGPGSDGTGLNGTGLAVGILDATVTPDDQGIALALRTEAVELPPLPRKYDPGLGQHLSDFTLNAALHGWPTHLGDRRTRADIWRAGGGKIEITSLVMGWGPLGLVASGQLGLDDHLQPDGAAHLEVRGAQTVLQNLGGNWAVVGSLLGASTDPVPLELRVKRGHLLVDRMQVAKLREVNW